MIWRETLGKEGRTWGWWRRWDPPFFFSCSTVTTVDPVLVTRQLPVTALRYGLEWARSFRRHFPRLYPFIERSGQHIVLCHCHKRKVQQHTLCSQLRSWDKTETAPLFPSRGQENTLVEIERLPKLSEKDENKSIHLASPTEKLLEARNERALSVGMYWPRSPSKKILPERTAIASARRTAQNSPSRDYS